MLDLGSRCYHRASSLDYISPFGGLCDNAAVMEIRMGQELEDGDLVQSGVVVGCLGRSFVEEERCWRRICRDWKKANDGGGRMFESGA